MSLLAFFRPNFSLFNPSNLIYVPSRPEIFYPPFMDHYRQVKTFFDRTAARYRERPRAFRAYYFGRRIELALERILDNQRVIDVGCGRGELFDRLAAMPAVQNKYIGLDISPVMLELSRIPADQQQQKTLEVFVAESPAFLADRIIALGLTTYYQAVDLPIFYVAMDRSLASNGKAVVSYTHSASFDFRIRRFLHLALGKVLPRERSLGRKFTIHATTPTEVAATLPAGLKIESIHWLPAAIPLITHWFPHLSVRLSKGILKNCSPSWRGDFVVTISK